MLPRHSGKTYLGGGSGSMLECLPSAFNSHTEYTCTHRHRQTHIHGGGGVEGGTDRHKGKAISYTQNSETAHTPAVYLSRPG